MSELLDRLADHHEDPEFVASVTKLLDDYEQLQAKKRSEGTKEERVRGDEFIPLPDAHEGYELPLVDHRQSEEVCGSA
jgi:hypothetical protein